MAYRMHTALIASLGAVALTFGTGETFAGSGAAPAAAAARGAVHAPVARSFGHHRGNRGQVFWPGFDDSSYGYGGYGGYGNAPVGFTQPASQEQRYSYIQDVPWDWAHRFPPNVNPSDRPYVSECPEQTISVPGHGGAEQTVNIMRCY